MGQYCHPFGEMFEMIHSYYLPSMIFVGLVGNLLSCIVFLNSHLKMRSSSYYLAALACADFGFLASLLLVWLNSTLEVPIFNKEGYCQCIVYVSSVCGFLSVWLIVAFTVERFIAVQYPLHRPQMCTVARAKAIVLYLLCIALASHTYVFLTSGIIKLEDGSQVCEMIEGHREAMRIINIIDSLLTLIAPLVLIVVMNTMITVNLIKFSKKFKRSGGGQSETMTRAKSEINPQILRSVSIRTPNRFPNSKSSSNNNNSRRNPSQQSFHSARSNNSFRKLVSFPPSKRGELPGSFMTDVSFFAEINSQKKLTSTRTQHSITKMLLLISTVFVFLNLPSYGIRLYVFIFFSIWSESPPVLLWCMQQMFMILYYTNFSINFLLYSMCGITFRKCLWQLIRKKLKKLSRYQCIGPTK
ncbi:UNVERIFIED_CONTAM: hypothetical protein PYX00_005612 [Menopon gallinae]|uniref:G-protein coupled receptors family 1 profile domain-containing protein n=1 Tax=Menopon gallinae TaxID=328185 RepID=A0AAW2HS93_9NEOP